MMEYEKFLNDETDKIEFQCRRCGARGDHWYTTKHISPCFATEINGTERDAPAHEQFMSDERDILAQVQRVADAVEGTERDGPAHELVRRIVRHRWDADWLYESLHRLVAQHPVPDAVLREMLREDDNGPQ